MKLPVPDSCNDWFPVTEIKYDLYNAFRNNILLMKNSQMIDLPDRMNDIFKTLFKWYVMLAFQRLAKITYSVSKIENIFIKMKFYLFKKWKTGKVFHVSGGFY